VTDTAAGSVPVEQTIRIAASPETVWTFWTEPQRLAEWWGVAVEVTMTREGDQTVLLLRHYDMPATHAPDHEKGWSDFVGERLVAAAGAA